MRLRFEKTLAVLLLMGGLVFVPPSSLWADEAAVTEEVSDEEEMDDGIFVSAPEIIYTLLEGDVVITVKNVPIGNGIVNFLFNGNDITEMVNEMLKTGLMEMEEDIEGNNFALRFNIEEPLSLEGSTFGMVFNDGLTISKPIKFEVDDGRAYSVNVNVTVDVNKLIDSYFKTGRKISYVKGKVSDFNTACYSWVWSPPCRNPATDATVKLYMRATNGKKEYWHNIKETKTENDGTYYFSGPIKVNGKNYCGPVLVKAYWVSDTSLSQMIEKSYTYNTCGWRNPRKLDVVGEFNIPF
jgi:hypothetical protein